MSVLTELIHEREGWCDRQKQAVTRQGLIKVALEYGFLVVVGIVCLFHERIVDCAAYIISLY